MSPDAAALLDAYDTQLRTDAETPGAESVVVVGPLRLVRFVAWPMVGVSILLLVLTQTSLGVEVNGNKNWLALGPFLVQPSEVAKFAMVLWCADVYALMV